MRRKKLQLIGLSLFVIIFVYEHFSVGKRATFDAKITPQSVTSERFSVVLHKHVTKSMAELGKMDAVNKYFLFLNHVPKCGSEILILLLQRLQVMNGFKHVRLRGGNKRYLTNLQQEELVEEVYDTMKDEALPLSFDRHVYFVNFTAFDKQLPIYINLVRNPVDRILSRTNLKNKLKKDNFYYKCLLSKKNNCNFKNGKPYDLSIPYFCGQDQHCMLLNNDWALQQAKHNVERYYPLVGILEELNVTLELLEANVAYFFKGAQKMYMKEFLAMNQLKKPIVEPEILQKLQQSLQKELEFYEWLKTRLFQQLQILYGENHMH